jgi:hypothetical protein
MRWIGWTVGLFFGWGVATLVVAVFGTSEFFTGIICGCGFSAIGMIAGTMIE